MSMFTLTGQIVNVFTAPKGISKRTGEEYGGDDKVQILGDIPLPGGECRKELVTLKTDQGKTLDGLIGQTVTTPVGFFASGKSVGFFIPQGHKIEALGKGKIEAVGQ